VMRMDLRTNSIVETECIYCAVGSESLNIIRFNLSLERVKTNFCVSVVLLLKLDVSSLV
jgi:hypothetical protein